MILTTRFGGNEATREDEHEGLAEKQQNENFNAIKLRITGSIFIRLQKLDIDWQFRIAEAPWSIDNRNWNQSSSSKALKIEDASENSMCSIDVLDFDWK
ncbi:hypothetical protein Tco_0663093 [Tanacetum coccineum]